MARRFGDCGAAHDKDRALFEMTPFLATDQVSVYLFMAWREESRTQRICMARRRFDRRSITADIFAL
jgi:hypothetical protein